MYNQQQQQSLPFDPQNLMFTAIRFPDGNPPAVPQDPGTVPPFVRHLIVPMASVVANFVTDTCMKNASRTFLFNQVYANQFQNADYMNLVFTAMDMLCFGLANGEYQSPEAGVMDAGSKAVGICASLNFQKFPQLAQFVHPEVLQAAQRNLQSVAQISQALVGIKQQMFQQNPGGGAGGFPRVGNGSYANMNNGGGGYGNNNGGNYSGGYSTAGRSYPGNAGGYMQPNAFATEARPLNSSGSVFSNNPNQPGNEVAAKFSSSDKYGYLTKKPEPAAMPNQNSYFDRRTAPPAIVVETTAVPVKLVWAPSPLQSHPVTIDERTQKIGLKQAEASDGGTYVISYIINLTEQEIMDRNRHAVTPVGNAFSNTVPDGHATREVALTDSVNSMGLLPQAAADNDKPVIADGDGDASRGMDIHERPQPLALNFEAEAIFNGRMAMRRDFFGQDIDCKAYRHFFVIGTPVIVDVDHQDWIDGLRAHTTYADLVQAMKEGLEDPSKRKLVAMLEKSFTDEVNSMLANQMSIKPERTRISSFMADAVDLIGHLAKTLSAQYSKAYENCQGQFANVMLGTGLIDQDIIDAWNENVGGMGDGTPEEELTLNYLPTLYSITYLEVHSEELGVATVAGDVAGMLTANANPVLYKLATDVFTNEGGGLKPLKHLLVTADDVIYDLHRGLVNSQAYTIRKR